jgi:hypothetical protein
MNSNGSVFIEPNLDSSQSNKIKNALDTNTNTATSSECENSSILARNVMDNYLKKHKLDLKILPNKKMIKLSDLTASFYSSSSSMSTTAHDSLLDENANELLFANKITFVEDKDSQLNEQHSQECEEIYDEDEEDDNEVEEEDENEDEEGDVYEEEEEVDDEDEDGDDDYDGDFLDEDDDFGDFIENYRNNEKETDEIDDALNVTSESTTNSIQEFKIDTSETDGMFLEYFLQKGVRIYPSTVSVPYPTFFRERPFWSTAQRTVLL